MDDLDLEESIPNVTQEHDAAVPSGEQQPEMHKTGSKPSVSPVAPKPPMQQKPTLAEKTAEAENHNKHTTA